MLVVLLQILFVFACFLLVVAVLLQQGKGGGISSAFGIGGASQTLFGASGAGDFLTKATWTLGAAFMLLSLLLAVLSGSMKGPVRRSVLEPAGTAAPAAPPGGSETGLPGTESPATTVPAAPGTSPGTAPPGTTPGAAPATGGTAPATGGTAPATPPPGGTTGGQ